MKQSLKVKHIEKEEGDFLYIFDRREDDGKVDVSVRRCLLDNHAVDRSQPEEVIEGADALMAMSFNILSVYYDLRQANV